MQGKQNELIRRLTQKQTDTDRLSLTDSDNIFFLFTAGPHFLMQRLSLIK